MPALALGVDPIDKDRMESPPVKQNSGFFAGHMGYHIVVEGCMIGALAMLAYTIGRLFFDVDSGVPIIGRTMAFAVLSLSQLAHAFDIAVGTLCFFSGDFSQ